jgi:aspartyl/asparaginyl-tRNA synthetase
MNPTVISPKKFSAAVCAMRSFFQKKGFIEVHTQNALSILAACEDPKTITKYSYNGQIWPLPQTGQMWLEDVLLSNPEIEGCFTVSTSYRSEKNPIPGRHDVIFPMFEFESKGDIEDMIQLEVEFLDHLGFERTSMVDTGAGIEQQFPGGDYYDIMERFNTDEIEHEHEQLLEREHGPVYFIRNFPYHTSPFWNMKRKGDIANKVDVILHGIETIGSAERSCDPDEMHDQFLTISNGKYAELLYAEFGRDRVDKELDAFLEKDFFPRFGGGIGMTRMIRAMEKSNLITEAQTPA